MIFLGATVMYDKKPCLYFREILFASCNFEFSPDQFRMQYQGNLYIHPIRFHCIATNQAAQKYFSFALAQYKMIEFDIDWNNNKILVYLQVN